MLVRFPFRGDVTADAAIAPEDTILGEQRPGAYLPVAGLSRQVDLKVAGHNRLSCLHCLVELYPADMRRIGASGIQQRQALDVLRRFADNFTEPGRAVNERTIGVALKQPVAGALLKIIEQQCDDVFLMVHFLGIEGFLQMVAMLIENHAGENEAIGSRENSEGEGGRAAEL